MRRAFKVATIFTGAAACAAVFTPATTAGAATTGQMKPDTSDRNCYKNDTTSAAFYYPASKDHGPLCFGGANSVPALDSISPTVFAKFCAGNNSGYYVRTFSSPTFSRGNRRTLNTKIFAVHIGHYQGSDYCSGT